MRNVNNMAWRALSSLSSIRLCTMLLLMVLLPQSLSAVTYVREDSLRVVELLRKGAAQTKETNLMLFYAHQFVDRPYVARTLEVNEKEELAVNLGQLDCTTLVETVTALVLTTKHGSTRWADFLHWLKTIRYRAGKLDGYCSRNHYFSQWIQSNEALNLVQEVKGDAADKYFPFTEKQLLDLHYMSQHPSSYPMLNGRADEMRKIKALEKEASGCIVRYIPVSLLGRSRKELQCIHDGDILAMVTKKDGLDVSHLGLAQWGKDGKLHLLNASSIHKKVVLETMTLQQYMSKHPSQLGIRVVRVKQ